MTDFWGRRKAAVEAEAQADDALRVAAEVEAHESALAEKSDEDLLSESGLTEPEALESAEQVQDFLKADLPRRLKTRALRRLWRLNPVLANLDGLVDYGEDYTDSATVVENLQTVYQVGKGMFDKLEEMAKKAEETTEAPVDAAAVHESDAQGKSADADATDDTPGTAAVTDGVLRPLPSDDASPSLMSQRRMRFEFRATEG